MERMQKILQASLVYRLLAAISLWFGRQWAASRVVQAFLTPSGRSLALSQGSVFARIWAWLHRMLCLIYDKLHLERVFDGSIFGRLWLWAAAALVLCPLLPTMAVAALAGVSFCSLALRLAQDRERELVFTPANKYILLYAAIYLVGTFGSVTRAASLPVGLLTVFFTLFALVPINALQTRRQVDRTVELMVLAAAAVSLYGIVQYVFRLGDQGSGWVDEDMFSSITFRVSSTLQNPNMLAQYLIMLIPLGGACLLTAKGWKKRTVWFACCGVMCLCMLVTFSRGGYLGLLFAGLVFFVLLNPRLLFLAPVALVALYFVLPDTVIERFASIGNLADNSTSYRVGIWVGALRMLADYWLCGVGPGVDAFNAIYPAYSYDENTAQHSHNLFLQITCDAGILALIAFCLILFWYFRTLCAALHREREWTGRLLLIAFISGMCGFMVEAMADYSFYNYRVMFLFWGYLALGFAVARRSQLPEEDTP